MKEHIVFNKPDETGSDTSNNPEPASSGSLALEEQPGGQGFEAIGHLKNELQKIRRFENMTTVIDLFIREHGREQLHNLQTIVINASHPRSTREADGIMKAVQDRYGIAPTSSTVSFLIDTLAKNNSQAIQIAAHVQDQFGTPINQITLIGIAKVSTPNQILNSIGRYVSPGEELSDGLIHSVLTRPKTVGGAEQMLSSLRTNYTFSVPENSILQMALKAATSDDARSVLERMGEYVKTDLPLRGILPHTSHTLNDARDAVEWFKSHFPHVTITENTANAIAAELSGDDLQNPVVSLREIERMTGVPAGAVVFKSLLFKSLQNKNLSPAELPGVDELLFGLNSAGITLDDLAKEELQWRFLAARYYFIKNDIASALNIFRPILGVDWKNKGIRDFALGMLATYLPADHPILLAAGTAEEIRKAVELYTSINLASIGPKQQQFHYGGGNIWDDLHTTPVNKGALREILPLSKE